jgi:hypothetical protein
MEEAQGNRRQTKTPARLRQESMEGLQFCKGLRRGGDELLAHRLRYHPSYNAPEAQTNLLQRAIQKDEVMEVRVRGPHTGFMEQRRGVMRPDFGKTRRNACLLLTDLSEKLIEVG